MAFEPATRNKAVAAVFAAGMAVVGVVMELPWLALGALAIWFAAMAFFGKGGRAPTKQD